MPVNDLKGKAVLVTGGTMGIGLATGNRSCERSQEAPNCCQYKSCSHREMSAGPRARFGDRGTEHPVRDHA